MTRSVENLTLEDLKTLRPDLIEAVRQEAADAWAREVLAEDEDDGEMTVEEMRLLTERGALRDTLRRMAEQTPTAPEGHRRALAEALGGGLKD